MPSKFNISALPDKQINKNILQKKIVISAKNKDNLLTIDDIKNMYNRMIKDDEFTSEQCTILYQNIIGQTSTIKSLGQEIKDYDDDYYNDRVDDTLKFEKGTKAVFVINVPINKK